MKDYVYIIVGGGMTAGSAIQGIREIDQNGKILMVSTENSLPYNRPPLSKKLWTGGDESDIYLDVEGPHVDILLNTSVLSINPDLKRIAVSSGESFSYEQLLLATGGHTKELPFGEGIINYYRTIADYHQLRSLAKTAERFAVIGAGFIGSEIAAALTMNEKKVTILEAGPGIGWKIFPEDVVDYLNAYYLNKGVEVKTEVDISSVEKADDEKVIIKLKSGEEIIVDGVIAGVGIEPNQELAEECELAVDDGIHVNELLQTSDPSIYAAGDSANFYNPLLDRRIRVEHADNAKAMGKQAGRNMADANEKYTYLPLFYSDMFDIGYEAVGILDSRLKVVEDWQEPFQKGVLYYLEGDDVVGVLLWNVWGKTDAARELIGDGKPYSGEALKGLIT